MNLDSSPANALPDSLRGEGGHRSDDGYADLRDYAVIGDGRTVALIARDGRIDWLPMPALHTPPVFAAVVDGARGGYVDLRPTAPFETSREYEPGTNVLRTRFRTATGEVLVTDALVTGIAGRLPWSELARRIEGLNGEVELTWSVVPGNAFGTDPVRRVDTMHGPVLRAGDINLALVGFGHGRTDPTQPGDGVASGPLAFTGTFTTSAGTRHLLCLCGTDDEPVHLPDPHVVDRGIDRTIASWVAWSTEFHYEGPWADTVQRSALALKLLIFSPTGAIAAAATTSLPENLNGGKNWDYRFAWVRDLAYTVHALLRFGLREETHAAVSWLLTSLKENDSGLHIFLELDGSEPGDAQLTDAEGWRGIGPVADGNPASGQLQLGVYADLLDIMRVYAESGNMLDETTDRLLCRFADEACRRWQEKDSGMWELPESQHYVSSKMGCWQAITAACRLAELGQIHPDAGDLEGWRRNRELIRAWVDENGWSEERGAYLMYPGSDMLDASVLLHAISGFDTGERMSRTIDRIREELSSGALVFRYGGVDAEEGTFTACAFWVVSALAEVGRVQEARSLMDELVRVPNDVGILSEMISAETGAFLGNLPQALSHLALINAAITLDALLEGDGSDPHPEEAAA